VADSPDSNDYSGPSDIAAGNHERITMIGAPLLQAAETLTLTADPRRAVTYEAPQLVVIRPRQTAPAIAATVIDGDYRSRHDQLVGTPWTEAGIGQPIRSSIRRKQAITVQPRWKTPCGRRGGGWLLLHAALHSALPPHTRRTRVPSYAHAQSMPLGQPVRPTVSVAEAHPPHRRRPPPSPARSAANSPTPGLQTATAASAA
jgi:hypothetical protein